MGREGKGSCKRNFKRRVRSKDRGSDDSDEDYVVSNDEVEEESEADLEEYCSSLDGDASEEGLRSFIDEEDDDLDEVEEEGKRKRKVGRPKAANGVLSNGKRIRSRKRYRVVSEEEELEEDEVEEEAEDGDYEEEEDEVKEERRMRKVGNEECRRKRLGKRKTVLYVKDEEDGDYEDEDKVGVVEPGPKVEKGSLGTEENGGPASGKMDGFSYEKEEEDDRDYEQEYDDNDEEFAPDDDVSLDEEDEEELVRANKKNNNLKVGKRSKQKRRSGEGRRRRKNNSVRKEPLRKRGRKKQGRKRKKESDEDDDGDFIDDSTVARKKAKKKIFFRKSSNIVLSDSDFLSSEPSDYEYTISEEEREQVREASKLLRTTSKILSSSSKRIQETEDSHQLRKVPAKKGKEKVEVAKSKVVKPVCGICLSEEDKRRLRGTLDCCSHYFCFTCIMEWSKVESRCPLCKQRFKTISKPARSTPGVELREVVIPVPERDQVYQPTEEELRSYLDPYENVLCTECHQGGDDGLMLLCDLCDSSAHTYCVGLGREVPEGNWYCEGCRPVALGFSSSQAPNPSPDQRTVNNRPSPFVNSGDFIDPALLSFPHNPFFHGFGNLPSPRFPNGNNILETSPSGSGAPTLSRRRTLHRHIQNLLNANRVSSMAGNGRTDETSNADNGFFVSQIDRSREITNRSREITTMQTVRTLEMVTPHCTIFEEKLRDNVNNPSSSAQARDLVCSISGHLRREEPVQVQTNSGFVDRPGNLTLWPGLTGIGPVSGYEQFQMNSGIPNTVTVFKVASEGDFSVAREQLQLTVKTHLRNLSRHIDLGQGNFNEIATCSIHTILAACGLEHRSNLVHVVPPPVKCSHLAMVVVAEQTCSSLMKGCCSSCFDSFVKDVVKMIMDTRLPQWLSLGL